MKKWFVISLFNLVVLTLLGLLLRYKINYPLPFIEQKNLLHAHSHFAFNGWISFLLQVMIVKEYVKEHIAETKFWNRFFLASTIVNYGMIVTFAMYGYAAVSIVLSTAALWLSYLFAYKIYRSLNHENSRKISALFIRASLLFLVLSSLGPYALAIITAAKSSHNYWYHNALYFFLHFQYNGWFAFATLAFLVARLEQSIHYNYRHAKKFFNLLFITCIPSLFFTMLWHQRPFMITSVIFVTAILQTASLYYLNKLLVKNKNSIFQGLAVTTKWLYTMAIAAFVLKVLLQFFSVHPQLGQIAFGFRPIIIGYLHLIFLGFITMYLLGYLADNNIVSPASKTGRYGLAIFATGIILNEVLLAIQGAASIFYIYLPNIGLLLFYNTILLVVGAVTILLAAIPTAPAINNYSPNTKNNSHANRRNNIGLCFAHQ